MEITIQLRLDRKITNRIKDSSLKPNKTKL